MLETKHPPHAVNKEPPQRLRTRVGTCSLRVSAERLRWPLALFSGRGSREWWPDRPTDRRLAQTRAGNRAR